MSKLMVLFASILHVTHALEPTTTETAKNVADADVQQTLKQFSGLKHEDAGTELYILATNFLLYIALVILTILMQRVYFPHTLPDYKAPRVDDQEVAAEFGDFENDPMLKEEMDTVGPLPNASSPKGPALKRSQSMEATEAYLASIVDFKNHDHTLLSKNEVLRKLATCAIGLNISFVVTGILQERMLTQPYQGEYFTSSYGLVFLNRLGGFIISALLFYFTDPPQTTAIISEFSVPSVSNMLSSWCQYEALRYVSFPTQMLFKCFKLAPIMLMGKFIGNKSYPAEDYAVALMIGFGIAVFMISTEDMNFGLDSVGAPETWSGTLCGIMLLGFFLIFDSFTGQWQSRMFHKHEDLTPAHMMLLVNTFSLIFSFITLVHTKEIGPFMEFVVNHPEMHMHVVIFSIGNTIGQIFIFQTIRSFGAVVFAIVMNTRTILSILFSCVIYSHTVNSQGLFGLFIVFASVGYRIKRKTAGNQLLKWREQQIHGKEWFHGMHEHMDMQ
jgi:adenosine 3'-phospho 5'-phosphosulfate transporter B2